MLKNGPLQKKHVLMRVEMSGCWMNLRKKSLHNLYIYQVQCVPLPTGPGTSLIILTPMKILQRNLNRSTLEE